MKILDIPITFYSLSSFILALDSYRTVQILSVYSALNLNTWVLKPATQNQKQNICFVMLYGVGADTLKVDGERNNWDPTTAIGPCESLTNQLALPSFSPLRWQHYRNYMMQYHNPLTSKVLTWFKWNRHSSEDRKTNLKKSRGRKMKAQRKKLTSITILYPLIILGVKLHMFFARVILGWTKTSLGQK
jgi:hypothetical protein